MSNRLTLVVSDRQLPQLYLLLLLIALSCALAASEVLLAYSEGFLFLLGALGIAVALIGVTDCSNNVRFVRYGTNEITNPTVRKLYGSTCESTCLYYCIFYH